MSYSDKHTEQTAPPLTLVEVRTMAGSDIECYCSLFQNVFNAEPWKEQWDLTAIKTNIQNLLRKKDFMGMAATAGSLPVGYVTGYNLGVWGRIFYVDQLFVAPRYQGKGIGTQLISALHNRLKSRKTSMVFLLTKPNTIAKKAYVRFGYKRMFPWLLLRGKEILYKKL